MSDNDLQLSGSNEQARTDPQIQDKPCRPRRAWTKRMAQALGLHIRLVQKMLEAGAPDATDEFATADWPQLERTWRGWIQLSRRFRGKARQLRQPIDLDHAPGVPGAMAGSAGGGTGKDSNDSLDYDPVKRRKCILLDLQIQRERGALIERQIARELLLSGLNTCLAILEEFPGLLAQAVPLEHRQAIRLAGKELSAEQRRRVEREVRSLWEKRLPPLISDHG